jgi:hypothetical protein
VIYRRLAVLTSLLGCCAALSACGLQPAKGSSNVTITVTRDFGASTVGTASEARIPSSQHLAALLRRYFRVVPSTIQRTERAINGYAGDSSSRYWFYYVNGIAVQAGATNPEGRPVTPLNTLIHPGDRVWWDLHDPAAVRTIPAVVGSFPEPFVHGIGGKRYPTTLECASGLQAACNGIGAQLRRDGVPVADQALGTGSGQDTLAIVVATWRQLAGSLAGDLVAHGPRNSGVYAKFADDGSALELLNPRGQVVRTLGAGAGLVAATNDYVNQPEWLITGTDVAGVAAAASTVTPAKLHDLFALAVQGDARFPLPLDPTQ